MRICQNCGASNEESADFCIECGAKLKIYIENGMELNDDGSKENIKDTKTLLNDIESKFVKKKNKHVIFIIIIGILLLNLVFGIIAGLSKKNNKSDSHMQKETIYKEENKDTEKKEELKVGTFIGIYIGENKSYLVLKEDKTAKYYYYGVGKMEDCTWDFNSDNSKIILKWNGVDLYFDIPIKEKYFMIYGGGKKWDDEKYEKISSKTNNISVAVINDMFFNPSEYNISIIDDYLKTKTNDYVDGNIKQTDYYGINIFIPNTWKLINEEEQKKMYMPDDYNVLMMMHQTTETMMSLQDDKDALLKLIQNVVSTFEGEGDKNRKILNDTIKLKELSNVGKNNLSFKTTVEKFDILFEEFFNVIVLDYDMYVIYYAKYKNSELDRYNDYVKIIDSLKFTDNMLSKHNIIYNNIILMMKAVMVGMDNCHYIGAFDDAGDNYDPKRFRSFNDIEMSLIEEGKWTNSSSIWHVDGIVLKKDNYYYRYNMDIGINGSVIQMDNVQEWIANNQNDLFKDLGSKKVYSEYKKGNFAKFLTIKESLIN